MIVHETQVRVRYGETDQMGYVYYGKYAEYFEVGRTELIRSLGLTYKALEESGILMPVADLQIKYRYPAKYDDILTIRTSVPEHPKSSFLTQYEISNEAGQLLVSGSVKLAFVDAARQRPVRAPQSVLDAVKPFWPES
ncbi:thioesterase family protein [Pontibacter sp. G13]|uniref:acyl-CoA thioesterase n=1 Tax=Pontibacter sp. G13 TaxID=3074898 RepID=UPI00288BC22C|nr:thioesterase family protein [Pontibacter sp. G13]WNJ18821.1 thioesterase family protein [Pontibacter sp. G13]